MEIKLAEFKDYDEIYNIYLIAQKHMSDENNHKQWSDKEVFKKDVERYLNNKCFYIVLDENEIVGFFALIYGIDHTYDEIRDGQWLNEEEYVTIHKIASKYFQKHIASFILENVESKVKNQNIKNVRIDTHEKNISMRTFLEKRGFKKCGVISIEYNFNNIDSLRYAYQKVLK